MSVYRTTGPLFFNNIHRNSIKFSFLEDYEGLDGGGGGGAGSGIL